MKDSLFFPYKDIEIYIAAPEVTNILLRDYPRLCAKYELKSARKFKEGIIHRSYAWDSIAAGVQRLGGLDSVFKEVYKGIKDV